MRKNKGITMISLVITIIVLLILTSVTIYNGLAQLGIKRVNNLYADIDSLSTKVAEYYLKNETIPIYNDPYVENKDELKAILISNGATETEELINVNDEGAYYVIDLSKLDNLTLNYGDDYKTWNSSEPKSQNVYIINTVTHQIYFPHGIRSGDDYYFTRNFDNETVTPISLNEISENLSVAIKNISGDNFEDDTIYVVADVALSGNLSNYDLDSLEYAWSETDNEENISTLSYTKFKLNNVEENSSDVILSKNAINRNQEYIYLIIKALDKNGDTRYILSDQTQLPIVLPKDYQKVEYIKSTDSHQYIDTGLILNENSGYYIDFTPYNDTTATQAPSYINAGGAGGDNIFTRMGISVYVAKGKTGTGELQFFNYKFDPKISKNGRTKMSIINKVLTYNDGTTVALNPQTKTTSNSLLIFAAHTDPIARFSEMELYNLKIFNLNEVIRNYIPCYRKSDNVKGLYDLIEGGFYENLGDGDDFTAGNVVD